MLTSSRHVHITTKQWLIESTRQNLFALTVSLGMVVNSNDILMAVELLGRFEKKKILDCDG
jgi:hypothetical protein